MNIRICALTLAAIFIQSCANSTAVGIGDIRERYQINEKIALNIENRMNVEVYYSVAM
jgi:hypothetical protein